MSGNIWVGSAFCVVICTFAFVNRSRASGHLPTEQEDGLRLFTNDGRSSTDTVDIYVLKHVIHLKTGFGATEPMVRF